MKSHIFTALFLITLFLTFRESVWSQKLKIENNPDELVYPKKGTLLGNYYKVDQIIAIEVRNDWKDTKHVLSGKKLEEFKNIMRTAVYRVGLETKPGHIFIKVKFQGEKDFSKDYIYLNSSINFGSGINELGEKFVGTFRPATKVNFENY